MPNTSDMVRDIVATGNITVDTPIPHIVTTISEYVDNPFTTPLELSHLLVRVLVHQDRLKRDRMSDHITAAHNGRPDLDCERCIGLTRDCGVDLAGLVPRERETHG